MFDFRLRQRRVNLRTTTLKVQRQSKKIYNQTTATIKERQKSQNNDNRLKWYHLLIFLFFFNHFNIGVFFFLWGFVLPYLLPPLYNGSKNISCKKLNNNEISNNDIDACRWNGIFKSKIKDSTVSINLLDFPFSKNFYILNRLSYFFCCMFTVQKFLVFQL